MKDNAMQKIIVTKINTTADIDIWFTDGARLVTCMCGKIFYDSRESK